VLTLTRLHNETHIDAGVIQDKSKYIPVKLEGGSHDVVKQFNVTGAHHHVFDPDGKELHRFPGYYAVRILKNWRKPSSPKLPAALRRLSDRFGAFAWPGRSACGFPLRGYLAAGRIADASLIGRRSLQNSCLIPHLNCQAGKFL